MLKVVRIVIAIKRHTCLFLSKITSKIATKKVQSIRSSDKSGILAHSRLGAIESYLASKQVINYTWRSGSVIVGVLSIAVAV